MKYKITVISKSWHEKIYEEEFIDDAIEKAKKDAQEFNGGKIISIHVDELSTQPKD